MRILIDLYLDGYDSEEEMEEACTEYILESLDFSASSVKIISIDQELLNNIKDYD